MAPFLPLDIVVFACNAQNGNSHPVTMISPKTEQQSQHHGLVENEKKM
jgi:hypothetical protein